MSDIHDEGWVGLAKGILEQCTKDVDKFNGVKTNSCKGDYVCSKTYDTAIQFEKTELYAVCTGLIDEANEMERHKYAPLSIPDKRKGTL